MTLEQNVSNYLVRWAEQLKNAKRSNFRVTAVKKASFIVMSLPLQALVDNDSLKNIKGIGPEIEAVIKEIVATGKCADIDAGTAGQKTSDAPAKVPTAKPIFYWAYSKKLARLYKDFVEEEGRPFIVVTPATQYDKTGYLCDGGCDTKQEEKELETTIKILEGMGFDVDISGCEGNICFYNNGTEQEMFAALAGTPQGALSPNLVKFLEECGPM